MFIKQKKLEKKDMEAAAVSKRAKDICKDEKGNCIYLYMTKNWKKISRNQEPVCCDFKTEK